MLRLGFIDKIKDPIWDWIPITDVEKEIINTSTFGRLRHVRQMSMAHLTYPGANHTRFEHSVGCMHVAYNIVLSIPHHKYQEIFGRYMDMLVIQSLRIAALLHDIGHPPFSHAVEWVFLKNPKISPFENYSHDEYTRKIIRNNIELGCIINRYIENYRTWVKQTTKYEVQPYPRELDFSIEDYLKAIGALAIGDERELNNFGNRFLKSLTVFVPILNGDLDADKIDYIIRDNYHCGFPTGVDFTRILDAFELYISNEDYTKSKLLLKESFIGYVETLLHSRLNLIDVIHHEYKNRMANQMLMRVIARILKKLPNRKEIVKKMHNEWTDYDMYNFITEYNKDDNLNKDWSNRLFKGQVLENRVTFYLRTFFPKVRRLAYVINSQPKYLIDLQDSIEKYIHDRVHIDFCFISLPPLTLQLLTEDESKPYLYDLSDIISGIIMESFSRSFISIYSDSKKIVEKEIKLMSVLEKLIEKIGIDILKNLAENKRVLAGETILAILFGIDRFIKKHLDSMPLWIYALSELQRFTQKIIDGSRYTIDDLKDLKKYDVRFYRETTRLVFCGLIDRREKVIRYPHPQINYKIRLDHKINSFGREYFEKLPKQYHELSDYVCTSLEGAKKPIIDCIEYQKNVDKVKDYEEFRKKVTKYRKQITESGGCVLVL